MTTKTMTQLPWWLMLRHTRLLAVDDVAGRGGVEGVELLE